DYIEHSSVSETSRQMNEPVNLKRCLEAFTLEERLRDEERVFCPNCHSHQICCKKLQIWRLPPILIVHLKRFQLIGGRWMKSPKAVHFTLDPLDPSEYLAAVPREAVLNRTASLRKIDHNDNTQTCHTDSEAYLTLPLSDGQDSGFSGSHENIANNGGRRRVVSTSLSTHPPSKWGTIQDFHEHKLIPDHDPLDLSYRLYAAVCHSGIMGGGHYVAYACHDDGKWYCYNDSSCKEVEPTQIDPHDIYMLLYERIGLDGSKYVNPDGVDSGEDSASSSNSTPSGDPDKKSELFSESDKKNCICPSDDPLDHPDFNEVDYINKLFPNEQSLTSIDDIINNVKSRISNVDDEIRTSLHQQNASAKEGQEALIESQRAIQQLFNKIKVIKSLAEESESNVCEITRDIKQLDCAKRNLTSAITTLNHLHMFVDGIESLQHFAKKRQYSETANLIEGISNVVLHLQTFKEVPHIQGFVTQFQSVQESLGKQILQDFKESLENPSRTGPSMNELGQSCKVLDVIGHTYRNKPLNLQLVKPIFRPIDFE
ncbi:hypothetical protein QYM36_013924, partial [Artemia franciscana]